MKQRNIKGLLETLLVIGLILIIPLFFAIRSQAGPQAEPIQNTAMPLPLTAANAPLGMPMPTTASAPEGSNAMKPKQPPACTFPLAQIKTKESKSGEYTFSEPQVVLTAPKGNIYRIYQWLPDNQQVLITEELRSKDTHQKNSVIQQSISLLNAVTGVSKVYATRPGSWEPPAWNPALNAVVYPAKNYTSVDNAHSTSTFTRQVWISYGDPNAAQKLADNLSQFPFGGKPDGSKMIYRSDNKITGLDNSLKNIPSVSFDPTQWDYAKDRRDGNPVSFQMVWQPGTSLVFLYSAANGGGGYTFILNTDTGQVCELNLGGWAELAHWSSNGRYLAFVRSVKYTYPTFSADLTVLDTVTGDLKILNFIPQKAQEVHLAYDFSWAPDNRHLAVIGGIYTSPDIPEQTGLYLVDFVSGQSIKIDSTYNYDELPNSIVWSADGSKLAVLCPEAGSGARICFISAHITRQ